MVYCRTCCDVAGVAMKEVDAAIDYAEVAGT
jgi:hypothetical protein